MDEAGWALHFNGVQADSFGKFKSRTLANSAGTGGVPDGPNPEIVFTLASLVINYPPNVTASGAPNDSIFAVHIRYSRNCSGFASDGVSDSGPGSDTNCAAVPEPSSLLLTGVGLISFGLLRRKLSKG